MFANVRIADCEDGIVILSQWSGISVLKMTFSYWLWKKVDHDQCSSINLSHGAEFEFEMAFWQKDIIFLNILQRTDEFASISDRVYT